MNNVFYIDDLDGPRFELAVGQLETGSGFVFRFVWFRKEDGRLECEAISPYATMVLTTEGAAELIEHAQATLRVLQTASESFRRATRNMKPGFSVIIDDAMGTVRIFELTDGAIRKL